MSLSLESQVGVALDDLFPSGTRTGTARVRATSCATDWREVQPGDVYVALPEGCGTTPCDDGHQHAQRAVSCGAKAVICEQPVPVFDVPTYLVPDSRVALGELCQALVGNPTHSLPTIGVTGTAGKTTTLALLEAIFLTSGRTCGVLSNLTSYDGMSVGSGISEAPSAPALASRLANMAAADCPLALLEVSSQSLSQAGMAGIQLDAICVTNITDAHLDLHNSIQNYRNAKLRILKHLAPTGVTILNADDPVCMQWLDRVQGPVLTYGLGDQAEITGSIIETHANEQTFVLTAGSESTAVRTAIIGEHHVSNCLAAAAVALSYGIDLTTIAAGIEAVEKLPARMERIDRGQGFPVYIDAAETPVALCASLRTARQLAGERVICVLGDMSFASAAETNSISQVVHRLADIAIATQHLPNAHGQKSAEVKVIADRSEAIAWAVAIAKPGDVVVVTGSQPRSSCSFGTSGEQVNDAEIARKFLITCTPPALRIAA